jgi:hypothetical protein
MLEDTPKEGSPLKINGSVMMAVASSKEEVMEKLRSDVYADKGVWDMDKVSFLMIRFKRKRVKVRVLMCEEQIQIFPFKSAIRSAL